MNLYFDTETTGLPRDKRVDALSASVNWPDLVSISWILSKGAEIVKKEYHIIRPQGWTVPAESSRIHGITQEIAEGGKDLGEVLALFKEDLEKASRVIAHNMQFDKNVVFHAYAWRLRIDPRPFWPSAQFCSMQKAKEEMKLPGMYPQSNDPYKMPKLDELYIDTFQESPPANAHSAIRDVEVLHKIVCERWSI